MRPVPPCAAAARVDAAVPSALASLQGFQPPLSSAGLRSVSTPAARTCRRPQPLWGRIRGAMTAALVIVPADPVSARSASAHGGRLIPKPQPSPEALRPIPEIAHNVG